MFLSIYSLESWSMIALSFTHTTPSTKSVSWSVHCCLSCPLPAVLDQTVFSPEVLHVAPLVLTQNLRPVCSILAISSRTQDLKLQFVYHLAYVISMMHFFSNNDEIVET